MTDLVEVSDEPRVSYEEALLWRLSSFMPSDRKELERAFATSAGQEAAIKAVTSFVVGWERADWLDANSIERIGKWFGKHAPTDVVAKLEKWSAADTTRARRALRDGMNLAEEAVRQLPFSA